MGLYETKVNMTLTRDKVDLLAGDTYELDDDRAAVINKELESAFPTLSPVLVPVVHGDVPDVNVDEQDGAGNNPEGEAGDTSDDADTNGDGKVTKDELKAALDAKGIKYSSKATLDDLKALLADA